MSVLRRCGAVAAGLIAAIGHHAHARGQHEHVRHARVQHAQVQGEANVGVRVVAEWVTDIPLLSTARPPSPDAFRYERAVLAAWFRARIGARIDAPIDERRPARG